MPLALQNGSDRGFFGFGQPNFAENSVWGHLSDNPETRMATDLFQTPPDLVVKLQAIDMVEVIRALSRQRNSSHGCVATGNQGTSCSQHPSPLVYHVIRGNVSVSSSLFTTSASEAKRCCMRSLSCWLHKTLKSNMSVRGKSPTTLQQNILPSQMRLPCAVKP